VFATGSLGQYYDVQGMTWTTAPQFDSPDQTIQVGGRTYYLYYEGSNLKMVAWYEHGAVYWVRNSLTDAVGSGELLAIAEQTKPFTAVHAAAGPVVLRASGVPTRTTTTKPISVREKIGALSGLITLVALPLLAFLAIRRIVDLRRARPHVAAGQQVGDRLAATGGLAEVPVVVPPTEAALRQLLFPPGSGMPRASGRWSEGTRVYRRSPVRRPGVLVPLAVALVAGAGAAVYLTTRSHSAPPPSRPAKRVHRAPTVPRIPVVVLNASSTAGAAHQLALALQADHVSVSAIGNVTETRPPGTEILYTGGERSQAELLARLLSTRSPTVAPIDPVTSAAAAGAQLVVVIS
jgi:hypothetical protein